MKSCRLFPFPHIYDQIMNLIILVPFNCIFKIVFLHHARKFTDVLILKTAKKTEKKRLLLPNCSESSVVIQNQANKGRMLSQDDHRLDGEMNNALCSSRRWSKTCFQFLRIFSVLRITPVFRRRLVRIAPTMYSFMVETGCNLVVACCLESFGRIPTSYLREHSHYWAGIQES